MMSEQRFTKAEAAASKLLRRFAIRSPRDLVLEDLAMALNVVVRDAPLLGAEARLIRSGDKGLIRVRENISEPGRRRFAIGHELGHWLVHHDVSQLNLCLESDILRYRGSREELEANAFSAHLLLPGKYLRETYPIAPTLELIRTVADDLITTLTATTVRIAETTNDPCFVVFSDTETQCVQWWRRSNRCPEVWLESQQPLSSRSAAVNAINGALSDGPESVDPAAWFPHVKDHDKLVVFEESMKLGNYPSLVTLLSVDWR